ncbi:LOW QUALITY PROTEIN: complement C3-like [Pecten maximus]|uniref:LOW QUALITY PROTEIN: complement C3-like n=1 Tax=Pecten maximus TaxID=6579 RepID=UPI0014590E7E|nr:LOW QUALITY PROTEIN: complement C3-like [Pecten maximus]
MELFLLNVVFTLFGLGVAEPVYFITSPSVLRFNSIETVAVNVFGISDVTVQIYLHDYPNRTRIFSQTSVIASQGHTAKARVHVRPSDLPDEEDIPDIQSYVYLVARSDDPRLSFVNETMILMERNTGFVFVQTDKPIYTPHQEVKIRVITLDEERKPTASPVTVDVKNPQGVVLQRWTDSYQGRFILKKFQLPSIPYYGKNWTITARYHDGVDTSHSVNFEVREYILPRFDVDVDVQDLEIILPSTDWINVTVSSKYVYGKPVLGGVTLTFGLVAAGQHETCSRTFNKLLVDGRTDFAVSMEELKESLESYWFPDGARMLIEAGVTDLSSGRKETAYHRNIVFSYFRYIVSVEKSQKYFKPGLLYRLHVETFWANGKQDEAPNVDIAVQITRYNDAGVLHSLNRTERTDEDGTFQYLVIMGHTETRMVIKVKALDPDVDEDEQDESILEVLPLYSPSESYLSIWTNLHETELMVDTISSGNNNRSLSYLLMSGGRILDAEQSHEIFHRPVTGKMSPGIRVLVFYTVTETAQTEIVADSTWIDVKNMCEKELGLSKERGRLEPGDGEGLTLQVSGAPSSLVGFLAVDRAVYLLNNKNVLRRHTMFKRFASHDIGCGFGGGLTPAEVFEDSGLAVITNADLETAPKEKTGCGGKKRGKRSLDEYETLHTHPCCVAGDMFGRDGVTELDCYTEGKAVYLATNNTSCSKIFFKCCNIYRPMEITDMYEFGRVARRGTIKYTFRDVVVDLENAQVRSYFPESWMFEEDDYLDENGRLEKNFAVPDSITTHIIQALTLSEDYGMCISKPERVQVFRTFFVDLEFPYSIVRLEQAEVRATIYNYSPDMLPCFVYIVTPDELCTPRSDNSYIKVEVHPNSPEPIKFPIVPLQAGEFEFEVRVYSINGTNDVVRKTVYVINEGREEMKTVSFWLDPQAHRDRVGSTGDLTVNIMYPSPFLEIQEATVDLTLPEKAIPGTGMCKVSAMGNIMDATVPVVLEGANVLLDRVPHGCGEQTMILLAPVVYTMRYLQRTEQLTKALEDRGRSRLRLGYQREMTFRKIDGSFAVWAHRPSSTWLTAFVVKVLSEATEFIDIDSEVICAGMRWLFRHQRGDGAFMEIFPLFHKEMMGGMNGEVSMTAYVLITLMEARCRPIDTEQNIVLALQYLESHLDFIDQTYPLVLTTYALVLGNSPRKMDAIHYLKTLSVEVNIVDGGQGLRYWSVIDFIGEVPPWMSHNPSAIDVEITAYAVLSLLGVNDVGYVHNVVEWLLTQKTSTGAFKSTQDTVVGLQALSEYNVRSYDLKIDLHTKIKVSTNDAIEHDIVLSDDDVTVQKAVHDIPVEGKLKVTTEGTGVGRMEVEVRYNVNTTEDERCKFTIDVYDSEVEFNYFQSKGLATDMNCDACGHCEQEYDEDFEDVLDKYNKVDLDPRIGVDHQRQSSRTKRSPDVMRMHGASKEQTCLEICVSYTGYEVLDMPVVDIGLPTGYNVERGDLEMLREKGIVDSYELSKRSVMFYLDQIPATDETCFKFRVVREFEVENLQAAKIEVYDYYKTEERCTKFYSLKYDVANLDIFCSTSKRENCHCVEGKCAESWDTKIRYGRVSKVISAFYRKICFEFDFALRIEVSNIVQKGNHMVISAVIKAVTKAGAEDLAVNDEIEFWMNIRCKMLLEIDHNYIIYGMDGIPYIDQYGANRYRYFLQGNTVILKDYTLRRYSTNTKLEQWKRSFRRMENYIHRWGC